MFERYLAAYLVTDFIRVFSLLLCFHQHVNQVVAELFGFFLIARGFDLSNVFNQSGDVFGDALDNNCSTCRVVSVAIRERSSS